MMIIKGILCLTTTFVTLGGCASVLAQRMARPDPLAACDYISYEVTEDGRCIDLSALTEKGTLINNSLSLKFFRLLRSKGIKITNQDCEVEPGKIKFGFYKFVGTERTMNFCKGQISLARKNTLYADGYIDTIAHESVHAVQHCIGDPNDFTPVAQYRPELWEQYVSLLGYEKRQNILEDYDDASNPRNDHEKKVEIEAWALQEKPELVLELLKDLC